MTAPGALRQRQLPCRGRACPARRSARPPFNGQLPLMSRAGHVRPLPGGRHRLPGGVKTAWRRTTSAASQQSWPAHAVVCPAGANIVRSPVSLRSTVVPRLQPRTSLRFAVHGCRVGSGLDRSGNLPSGSPFPGAAHVGAAHVRPAGVRKTGARGPGRRPGMPGPYRYMEQSRDKNVRSFHEQI